MATVTAEAIVWNTTAGAKTTASITPASGRLLVAVVGVAGVDTAPTMSDSKSGAWTLVDSFRSSGSAITGGLRMYVRNAAVDGTAMTVTVTPSGDAGGGLAVLSVSDPVAFGASAVRSTGGQADQAAGTPAPVLSNTPRSYNPVIVGVMTQSNSTTNTAPRTGYTEDYDQGFNTPASGLEVQHRDTGETSATLTLGAATPTGFASIGVEIHTIQRVTLTPAAATATAQALSVVKPIKKSLTEATATASAQALSVTKPIVETLVSAAEVDTAQAVSFTQPAGGQHVTLTPAAVATTALPLTFTKPIRKTLVVGGETDTAQPISFVKPIHKNLTAASDADLAQALGVVKPVRKTLTAGLETDMAADLRVSGPIHATLVAALEVDAAVSLSFVKPIRKSLVVAAEADQALSVVHRKALSLVPATELDTVVALQVVHPLRLTLVPGLETDLALALVVAVVGRRWPPSTDSRWGLAMPAVWALATEFHWLPGADAHWLLTSEPNW